MSKLGRAEQNLLKLRDALGEVIKRELSITDILREERALNTHQGIMVALRWLKDKAEAKAEKVSMDPFNIDGQSMRSE